MRIRAFLIGIILVSACVVGAGAAPDEGSLAAEPVAITAPPHGAAVDGEYVIRVSLNSSDKQPVTKVKVFLDGVFVNDLLFAEPLPEGSCAFKWDTARTPNGKHKLDIQAFSGDEYLGMASCAVTVANTAPDLEIPRVAVYGLKDGGAVSGTVSIAIEASDDSGQDPLVTLHIDKAVRSVKNRPPYTYDWDTTRESNGLHIVEVSAVDASNNTARAKPIGVTVHNAGGAIPLDSEANAAVPEVTKSVPPVPRTSSVVPRESRRRSAPETSRTDKSPVGTGTEGFEAGAVAPSQPIPTASSPRVSEPPLELSEAEAIPEESAIPPASTLTEPPASPTLIAMAVESDRSAVVMASDFRLSVPADRFEAGTPAKPDVVEGGFVVHTVQAGECIYSLARKYGVSEQAIIELNGIEDPNLIHIGDKLRVAEASRLILVRPVFEARGGSVRWNPVDHLVHAVCPDKDVRLWIGESEAEVNGARTSMERPAIVESGRTMVAESFVTRTLGMLPAGE